jgi:hypothetical protein
VPPIPPNFPETVTGLCWAAGWAAGSTCSRSEARTTVEVTSKKMEDILEFKRSNHNLVFTTHPPSKAVVLLLLHVPPFEVHNLRRVFDPPRDSEARGVRPSPLRRDEGYVCSSADDLACYWSDPLQGLRACRHRPVDRLAVCLEILLRASAAPLRHTGQATCAAQRAEHDRTDAWGASQ